MYEISERAGLVVVNVDGAEINSEMIEQIYGSLERRGVFSSPSMFRVVKDDRLSSIMLKGTDRANVRAIGLDFDPRNECSRCTGLELADVVELERGNYRFKEGFRCHKGED